MKIKSWLTYTVSTIAVGTIALTHSALAATSEKQTNVKKSATTLVIQKEDESKALRSCPAYGAGYFNIPGTTTCLKLSGYVRSTISAGKNISGDDGDKFDRELKGLGWGTRGTLNVQSASDTSLGTLRSYIQVRQDWQVGGEYIDPKDGNNAQLHFAYVELGGLRFGLDESIFAHWTGYYGNVLNDDLLTPLYASRTNVLSYVFNINNSVSAIVGAEQGTPFAKKTAQYTIEDDKIVESKQNISGYVDDYIPNLLFGAKYMQGWGGVSAITAYDSYYKNVAGKVRLDANINDFNLWGMIGIKSGKDYLQRSPHPSEDPQKVNLIRIPNTVYGDWFGTFAGWVGGTYTINDKMNVSTQLSMDSGKDLGAVLSMNYKITDNLVATPEIAYIKYGTYDFDEKDKDPSYHYDLSGKDGFKFMIQFQRSF